ncbi:MAG: Zn-dependent hydrolase [Anaerolineales bacterium]|nr:Zn-dependent hydrolase [Anaerolineales bacterium]MCB9109143.1 Zn-dependent hydrolase [Anaerolineales bacterium]
MLTINETRLLSDLAALAEIGRTEDGGVSRLALSSADEAGRWWFQAQVIAAGLEFRQDGAGNLSAVLPAADPQAQTLLIGSHLDTVLNGGRFDGALGVLAALEVARTLAEAGAALPFHLEVISFTDEEGAVVGLLGSQAVAGQLTYAHLANPRGGAAALEDGMARLGLTPDTILAARRDPVLLAGYVELHIEQGTRLEEAHLDIGVVTGIVGIRSAWLQFQGQAAHAGTMPMLERADALWGAAEFVQRARSLVIDRFSPGVMNCGRLDLAPGSFNIVPAEVKLALEFRHGTEGQLDEMAAALFSLAEEVAQANNLSVTIEETSGCTAAPAAETVVRAIETAADRLGLSHTRLMSFAGHDTQSMAAITPSAMIFVPSVNGVSHSPQEFSEDRDVINGANVLLQTVLALA